MAERSKHKDASAGEAESPQPKGRAVGSAEDGIAQGAERAGGAEGISATRPRSNLWQIPVILLSLALIVGGLYVASQRAPRDDFEGALDQVEEFIAARLLDAAEQRLRDGIEPNLLRATLLQQARFHSVVGDMIHAKVAGEPAQFIKNAAAICEKYAKSRELGATLSPAQLERWAEALVATNAIAAARERLREIEGIAVADESELDRRNRVLRRIVEHGLHQPDLSYQELLGLLGEYRADQLLSVADEAWAIARQAELRLEAGFASEAIDRLIVDMRRLEARADAHGEVPLGELYTLLGRGFFEQGELERAEYYLRLGQSEFTGPAPVRGAGLVLLGRIAIATGNQDDAFEIFNEVVRDYVGTPAALPALLGRADVRAVLGDHAGAVEDYTEVCSITQEQLPRRDVTPQRVARSLTDRHDAALAAENLELALTYVSLAERLFDAAEMPAECLVRIASTSRQLADDLVAAAVGASPEDFMLDSMDPAVRREANTHYKRAGDYYVRHARAIAASPTEDQEWADSLWLAADSYDHAGWHDFAESYFSEYISSRPHDDPRRSEATFRLAQAHHAGGNWDAALTYYMRVLQEHPRSPFASQSHVTVADCLVALGRQTEAEQHLEEVLAGKWFLTPDARDYREAHMMLGRLLYDRGAFIRAIEHLDQVVKRYPDEPRIQEYAFRLADAHRAHAAELEAQARLAPARSDQQRLRELRAESLRIALDLFAGVRDAYEGRDARRLDELQQSFLRHAYLYRADCAYNLGLYEQAIDLYDMAARKYSDHRVSMTALIQIVNCYHQMGDAERARAAHNRALVRLRQLPDASFDDPAALLDRQAWEQWLRNSPLNVASAATPDAEMP